jgi:amidase
MQIIGNHFEEEKLISIAFAFEQSTNIRAQVKPVVLPKTELYDVQHGTGLAKKKPENPHVL